MKQKRRSKNVDVCLCELLPIKYSYVHRDQELAKVKINKADVELIVSFIKLLLFFQFT